MSMNRGHDRMFIEFVQSASREQEVLSMKQ